MANTRRTADQWQTIIDQYPQSNLTVTEYCQQTNVSLSCFYQWRTKLYQNDNPISTPPQNDWLAITNHSPELEKQWDIELSLPNGVVLRMNHA